MTSSSATELQTKHGRQRADVRALLSACQVGVRGRAGTGGYGGRLWRFRWVVKNTERRVTSTWLLAVQGESESEAYSR